MFFYCKDDKYKRKNYYLTAYEVDSEKLYMMTRWINFYNLVKTGVRIIPINLKKIILF
jgi:hypothetical protein